MRLRLATSAVCALAFSTPLLAQSANVPIATTEVPASASPASGATANPTADPQPVEPCKVELVLRSDKSGVGDLMAGCSGTVAYLGTAVSFATTYNPSLQRHLIVSRSEFGAQIYMVRPANGETPALVENVTNDLAAAARGLKWLQVRELAGDIDISAFAESGEVRLTGGATDKPLKDDAVKVAVKIGKVGDLVAAVAPLDAKTPIEATQSDQPAIRSK